MSFFRDMHEEGMEGHTGAIQLLKPDSSVSNVAVRKFHRFTLRMRLI